jgi:hypothetical protein
MGDITLSKIAVASLPGRIHLNDLQWLRCYPKWPFIWYGSAAAATLLALHHHWAWWFLAVPLCVMAWLYSVRVREHFRSGDVCPAVVVSTNPLLLAVGTDLGTCFDPYPAIKVIQIPSASLPKQLRHIGARTATVALYVGMIKDGDSWEDFDPRPVGAATCCSRIQAECVDRIPTEVWRNFDLWMSQVQDLRPGLHRLA